MYAGSRRFPAGGGGFCGSEMGSKVGVRVRVDYEYAIMHDKFIVVDGETVEEGSFNYTAPAESKNAGERVCVARSGGGATIWAGVGAVLERVRGDRARY
jgi:phosphatidylserine/phosphatidylglycerophosphate/cardiolipin synthase-like enzyme